MGLHHDGQAGLELLTSGDPPTSASQSAGSHITWLIYIALFFFLSQGLPLSPSLQYSGTNMVHCSLDFLGLSDPSTSASQNADIMGLKLLFPWSGTLCLMPVIPVLWEAEVGKSPEVRSSRPAWPSL